MPFLCFNIFLVLAATLGVSGAPESEAISEAERSALDEGFARTASYLMKTAMKLPPHILPTLDELKGGANFPDASKSVGVYVPEGKTNVGIYMPKALSPDQKYKRHTENRGVVPKSNPHLPNPLSLRRRNPHSRPRPQRRRRPTPKRKPKHRFNIPFDPKRPLNFISSLGSQVNSVRQQFQNSRNQRRRRPRPPARRPPPVQDRAQTRYGPPNHQRSPFDRPESDGKHPYKFTDPDFNIPFEDVPPQAKSEPPLAFSEPFRTVATLTTAKPRERPWRKQGGKRPYTINNPAPAPNVPMFVKSLLANAFLKYPDKYFKLLEDRKRKRKRKRRKGAKTSQHRPERPPGTKSQDRPLPPHLPEPSYDMFDREGFEPSVPDQPSRPLNALFDDQRDYFDQDPFFEPTFSPQFPVPKRNHLKPFVLADTRPLPPPITTTTTPAPIESDDYEYYNYLDTFYEDHQPSDKGSSPDKRHFPDYVSDESINSEVDYLLAPPASQSHILSSNAIRDNPHRRNTICICCDESSTSRHHQNHAYSRRSMQVEGSNLDMTRLLNERAMLEQELDCSVQDPIEVVLVFESQKENPKTQPPRIHKSYQTIPSAINLGPSYDDYLKQVDSETKYHLQDHSYRVEGHRTPSQDYFASHEAGDSAGYYDPTKLTFIFSTPSPLRRKYIEIRDKRARQTTESTVERQGDQGPGNSRSSFRTSHADNDVYFASSSDLVNVRAPLPNDTKHVKNLPKSLREVVFGKA